MKDKTIPNPNIRRGWDNVGLAEEFDTLSYTIAKTREYIKQRNIKCDCENLPTPCLVCATEKSWSIFIT